MSQIEVERLLGRLTTDADFRTRAATSFEAACRSEGIALSAKEISLLCQIDFSQFALVAETLDGSIRRS